ADATDSDQVNDPTSDPDVRALLGHQRCWPGEEVDDNRSVRKTLTNILPAVGVVLGLVAPAAQPAPLRTHLVIVVDGLRPDDVTPDVMPRLSGLGRRGIVFTAHHSVFPTVT